MEGVWKTIGRTHGREMAPKKNADSLIREYYLKQKEYEDIYKWSEGIVKVCQWLELNLDDYCHKTMGYPAESKPVPPLDTETAKQYSSGLDEIIHNLQESQDFFAVRHPRL